MLITINHPELGPQKSYISAQSSAGSTYSYVENNDDFASGDLVLFGKYGVEKSEVITLTGTTDNNRIDHEASLFDHPARTTAYQMLFDQAEVHRADSEGGTYTLITTIDLNVDEPHTIYNDTGGDTSSWYKTRYKNSEDATYSDYSDEVQGTGYDEESLRAMTDEILEEFGDPDAKELSRDRIKNSLNAGVRILMRNIIKMYPDWRATYTTQALTANTATYSLPTRFIGFKRVDVNYSGATATSAYKAVYEGEEKGLPDTQYQKSQPRVYIRGSSFGLRPTPDTTGGYAFIWYWSYPASMDNESDTHGLPYGAREPLVAYGLFRAWRSKDGVRAGDYKGDFKDYMEDYLEFVGQNRQIMTSKSISVSFGSDLYEWD